MPAGTHHLTTLPGCNTPPPFPTFPPQPPQSVQKLGIKNWLVVAIDEQLRDYCKEHGINHYYRPVKVIHTR